MLRPQKVLSAAIPAVLAARISLPLHPIAPVVMETLKSAIGLCVKIHEMYGTFTSNKVQCHWLLSLVKNIMESLNLQLARDAVPEALEETLLQLQEDLRACKTVLEEFGMCGRLKRFVLGYKHAQQFADAGSRHNPSHTHTSPANRTYSEMLRILCFILFQSIQLKLQTADGVSAAITAVERLWSASCLTVLPCAFLAATFAPAATSSLTTSA